MHSPFTLLPFTFVPLVAPAAAFLIFAAPPAQAEPLGRLFLTPAERQHATRPAPPAKPVPPPRLDGMITRSDGPPVIFLDGKAARVAPGDVRIGDATARVTGADGRVHRLRVGDPPTDTGSP